MNERPTPAERKQRIIDIAQEMVDVAIERFVNGSDGYLLGCAAAIEDLLHECVIVHPDDAPEEWEYTDDQLMYQSHAERAFFSDGYRVCRSLIFGGSHE